MNIQRERHRYLDAQKNRQIDKETDKQIESLQKNKEKFPTHTPTKIIGLHPKPVLFYGL